MEKMVLEQYLKVLYPEVKAWVKERDPTTAAMAAKLVDAYVSAHKGQGSYLYAGQRRLQGGKSEGFLEGGGSSGHTQSQASYRKPSQIDQTNHRVWSGRKAEVVCYSCGEVGHTRPFCPVKKLPATNLCYVPRPKFAFFSEASDSLTVTVLVNGRPLTALLDTGCTQSLVQAKFVQRELWNIEETEPVVCVYGHSSEVPTAEVYLEVHNQPYLIKIGVTPELPYPVLLGTDFPILLDLIQECKGKLCGVITRSKAKELSPLPVLVDPEVESHSRVLQSVRLVSPLQLPEWLKPTPVDVGSSVLEAGTAEKQITDTDNHMPSKQLPAFRY